ncbi:MAG: sigma-70 family RNA polymerase sigma factor [Actinomycetota bacterium]|nr:sigma-70 family RNA polymerase sigma factor [Actinomycetota bacterium]
MRSDDDLAGPARRGNQLAPPDVPPAVPTWEEVARDHGRFLYTVAYRLTGNDADAQDLVQEVLVRVQRGLATYRPGSMEGWLSRITTNAFLDEVRRRRRRPTDPLPEEHQAALAAPQDVESTLAATTLPEEIQVALAALPDDFRVAVVLCDVVGLAYEEIADQLQIPVGTVRSRIHRGRSSLRRALARGRS